MNGKTEPLFVEHLDEKQTMEGCKLAATKALGKFRALRGLSYCPLMPVLWGRVIKGVEMEETVLWRGSALWRAAEWNIT